MIPIAYRPGLRVGELRALTLDQVDFGQGLLHVARLKNGVRRCIRWAVRRCGRCGTDAGATRGAPRVPVREGRADDPGRLPQDACQDRRGERAGLPGASAYATPCLRVQTR